MDKHKEEYPLVSVVAVCYNHERFVVEALDSIAAQTYPNIEFIIIDDCSTDLSVEVIKRWIFNNEVNATLFINDKNCGLTHVLNKALNIANGIYFKPISCDDVLHENYLTLLVQKIEQEGLAYAGVWCDAKIIDTNSRIIHESYLKYKGITMLPEEKYQLVWLIEHQFPAPSVLVRTKYLRELGGYDTNFRIEDYWLWLRLAEKYKWSLITECLVFYRKHYNSSHVSLSQFLFKTVDGLVENNLILTRYLFYHEKLVRRAARKKVLLNVNAQRRYKGSFFFRIEFLRLGFLFNLLLLALYLLPGYYWKKRLINRLYIYL